eukprot:g6785.t1
MADKYIPAAPPAALEGACLFPDDAPFSTWESLVGVKTSAGVHETTIAKVAFLPGGRTAELPQSRHLVLLGTVLQAAVDAPSGDTLPNITEVMGDARTAAKAASMSVDDQRVIVIRACVDATAAFLWTCPDHGGITHTSSLGILPHCGTEEDEEDEDASSVSKAGAVVELGTKRARPLSSESSPESSNEALQALLDAADAEELRGYRGKKAAAQQEDAGAAATTPQPKKTKATSITMETQIQAKMGTLTSIMPQMERIQDYLAETQPRFWAGEPILLDYARGLTRLRPLRDIFEEYATLKAGDVGQLTTCGNSLRAMTRNAIHHHQKTVVVVDSACGARSGSSEAGDGDGDGEGGSGGCGGTVAAAGW